MTGRRADAAILDRAYQSGFRILTSGLIGRLGDGGDLFFARPVFQPAKVRAGKVSAALDHHGHRVPPLSGVVPTQRVVVAAGMDGIERIGLRGALAQIVDLLGVGHVGLRGFQVSGVAAIIGPSQQSGTQP